jgi:hypothetical protein
MMKQSLILRLDLNLAATTQHMGKHKEKVDE